MMNTFLTARWENLIMANYEVNPDVLLPYLPKGVELDFFDGKTYVSLVGFMFKKTKIFHIPIPFLGTFEEVNLRFYVKRTEGDTIKRGVVFINEIVHCQLVAWLANKSYKEHFIAIPTKSKIDILMHSKSIRYEWKINKEWNHLSVNASIENEEMIVGSIEEYILEHYYGYTRIDSQRSQEYEVKHPRWRVNKVEDYSINCDFKSMYGADFDFLNNVAPNSVILAEGSPISVEWKRKQL